MMDADGMEVAAVGSSIPVGLARDRNCSKSEESHPDPLHESSCHGPNLYQVNEYSGSAEAQPFLFSDAQIFVIVHVQASFWMCRLLLPITTWLVVSIAYFIRISSFLPNVWGRLVPLIMHY